MHVVCDICCVMTRFRYKDPKQVTHMLMYLAACMINVFSDMVVTICRGAPSSRRKYNPNNAKFTTEYKVQLCVSMHVSETYEVHWPPSAASSCGTFYQCQTPFTMAPFAWVASSC